MHEAKVIHVYKFSWTWKAHRKEWWKNLFLSWFFCSPVRGALFLPSLVFSFSCFKYLLLSSGSNHPWSVHFTKDILQELLCLASPQASVIGSINGVQPVFTGERTDIWKGKASTLLKTHQAESGSELGLSDSGFCILYIRSDKGFVKLKMHCKLSGTLDLQFFKARVLTRILCISHSAEHGRLMMMVL